MKNLRIHARRPGGHRSSLLLACLALVWAGAALTAFAQSGDKRLALSPGEEVQVVYCEGKVTLNGADIDIGATVPENSLIVTGKGSMAEIAFNSKNIIRIGENTTVRLSLNTLKRNVDLKQGTFTAVLHRLDKIAGGTLNLKTPVAVGGVRGTSFCSKVEANGYTYFCSCNGSLSLQDMVTNSPFTQESAHHKGIWFTKDGNGIKSKPAGLEYHTDKDLETLAARIGETIDWTTLEH